MKNALPDNAKIAKEAKECMQECVSEFISFITSEGKLFLNHRICSICIKSCKWLFADIGYLLLASEKCQQEKRKTVNGEDILFAMTSLGFENYAEALKVYLSKYREVSIGRDLSLPRESHSPTPKQQQNQSNRERVMENTWGGSMMPGEKAEGAGSSEFATGEVTNSADAGADPNYMYSSHAAHNGGGAGEGY